MLFLTFYQAAKSIQVSALHTLIANDSEWSRSNLKQCQQINIVKNTNGEKQIKPRFEPAPVNKHHHHEWCEWSRTKIKPIIVNGGSLN